MSTSDTNSRKATKQMNKGRKPTMHTGPVGWGPTTKKSPRFPDYEQPFALIEGQLRERSI
jgi:hypothetical protein